MALIKLVKTKLNEGKQTIVVRFECVFCGASGVNRRRCAAGEADVAAEGWAVPALRDSVPSALQGPESGNWAIFHQVLPKFSPRAPGAARISKYNRG